MEPLDKETIVYVFDHCHELFTIDEMDVYKKTFWDRQIDNYPNKEFHKNRLIAAGQYPKTFSEESLKLLEYGVEQFEINAVRRIMAEHRNHPLFNYCPKCGRLARTPQAKQCRFCGYDWH